MAGGTASTGVPVVLVPGMGCDADLFADVRPGLAAAAIDAAITADSIDGMAEQVLAAAPSRFVVVGLSLGAIVGFTMLRMAPERIAGFAALSTNAAAPTQAQRDAWRALEDRIGGVDDAGFRDLVADALLPAMFAEPHPDAATTARFLDMSARIGPELLTTQLRAQATRVDAAAWLGEVTCPTTVVAAGRDALCPIDFHRRIADTIPGARLEVLPDAGHLSTWAAPESITASINELITEARS